MKNETKLCKYCQSEIPKKAKVCPVCKKKLKRPVLGIFIAIIGLIILISAASSMSSGNTSSSSSSDSSSTSNDSSNSTTTDTGINEEKFDSIENGMSYDQVKELIGEDGENISESEVAGVTTIMYQWTAPDGFGNAIITFQDDSVVNKSQMGVSSGDDVKITKEQYDSINTGMTYDEVVEVCGGEGTLLSDSDIAGSTAQVYEWSGESLGSNASITFSDGAVMSKAQFGLE